MLEKILSGGGTSLVIFLQRLASMTIHDNKSCSLWDDLWHGRVPKLIYREHFFPLGKQVIVSLNLSPLFHLPFAFQKDNKLQQSLGLVTLLDTIDQWTHIWCSPLFSLQKAYHSLIRHVDIPIVYSWLWNNANLNIKSYFGGY
jgi:hypothetical protein